VVSVFGQSHDDYLISGVVKDNVSNKKLANVVVQVKDYPFWTVSNADGNFNIEGLKSGEYILQISCLGYFSEEYQIGIDTILSNTVEIYLKPQSYSLSEVTVLGQDGNDELSTSLKIDEQAIEHIQATSLSDILQLLPGKEIVNPDLNSSNLATFHIAVDDALNEKIHSFGNLVVVDGALLNNNANLQVSNTAIIGAEGYFETNSGGGFDLREIPVDNIQSVEVISGVPSVKYGDLAGGAIIVKTKSGVSPWNGKIRLNPITSQYYLGKGFGLGAKAGVLNVDVNYTDSKTDIRKPYPSYIRYRADLFYNNYFLKKRWKTSTKLSFIYTHDQDVNEMEAVKEELRFSKDFGFYFNTDGKLRYKLKFPGQLKYGLMLNYKKQESLSRILNSRALTTLSTSLEEGVFEIPFIPSEYYSITSVNGEPLNFNAYIENELNINLKGVENRLLFGFNWKADANFGAGRIHEFDASENVFPRSSHRSRAYSDIPVVNQMGFYIEDNLQTQLFKRDLKIQAGVRFENIQPLSFSSGQFGTTLLPRINLNYNISKNINFRAAWGKSSKAPALVYLYPDKAYFDANTYQKYYADYPDLNMAYATTRIFNADNSQIRSAESQKAEIGTRINYKQNRFSFTAWFDELKGGLTFADELAVFDYVQYKTFYEDPDAGIHIVDTVNVFDKVYRDTYKKPCNSRNIKTKGLEFNFMTAKFNKRSSRISFSGAWQQSATSDSKEQVYLGSMNFTGNNLGYIGVYERNGILREKFLTTLRLIHHIPEFSLIASLSIQTQWIDKYRLLINAEDPIAYYDENGDRFSLDKQSVASGDYDFLKWNRSENAYAETSRPPLWLFSFKLTKEIKKFMMLSFYANNALMSNPLYFNLQRVQPETRNPELFFGAELSVKFNAGR